MLEPQTPYVLASEVFNIFASTIEFLKTPSRHISNISPYIQQSNFGGLKSHDYHVLMQQILPLALRGLIATYDVWVRSAVHNHPHDLDNFDNIDRILLCSRPTQRMRAFGNKFRMEDLQSKLLQIYDNENFFYIWNANCIFSIQGITKLYGNASRYSKVGLWSIANFSKFFLCEWFKGENNRKNPTYLRDDASFMVINAWQNLPNMSEPFTFPSQIQAQSCGSYLVLWLNVILMTVKVHIVTMKNIKRMLIVKLEARKDEA